MSFFPDTPDQCRHDLRRRPAPHGSSQYVETIKTYPNPPAPDFSCNRNAGCASLPAFPHRLANNVLAVCGLRIMTVKTDVYT